jgi:hypothetical protein
MRSRLVAFVLVLLSLISARVLHADEAADRDAARRVAAEGYRLLQRGDYQGALSKFQVAEQLVHAPPHLLYMARAHTGLGQLRAAKRLYRQILDEVANPGDPEPFRQARGEAATDIAALDRRLARLTIRVEGVRPEQAAAFVDGEPVAIGSAAEVDPGEHKVMVRTPGTPDRIEVVTLAEGAREEVVVRLTGVVASGPTGRGDATDPWIVPAIVSFGVGLVGIVAGAVTGALSLSKVGELDDRCVDRVCPTSEQELADEAALLGDVSTAMFVIGGVGVAAGVVLVAWQPGSSTSVGSRRGASAPIARLRVSPGAATLALTF